MQSDPSWDLVILESERDELTNLPDEDRERLTAAIWDAAMMKDITKHPAVEPLKDSNLYRAKAGKYRAIMGLVKPTLAVVLVGHRKNVYDDLNTAASRIEEFRSA